MHFSDKQKHIQALASHFTLCALARGNAFLEPLAYSPKNGSSWLSFKKRKKKRKSSHMWRIRLHLSSSTLSTRPLLPKPTGSPSALTPQLNSRTHKHPHAYPHLQLPIEVTSAASVQLICARAAVRSSLAAAEAEVSLFRALAKENLHYR